MPKLPYVYQEQEQKSTSIHVMKIHLKYEVNMLKDELTGNPRKGQNVIDKVHEDIFTRFGF